MGHRERRRGPKKRNTRRKDERTRGSETTINKAYILSRNSRRLACGQQTKEELMMKCRKKPNSFIIIVRRQNEIIELSVWGTTTCVHRKATNRIITIIRAG